MFESSPADTIPEKPFVIALEQRDRTVAGSFTPAASLKVTPALRTSGLLRALPPEDVAWLMFLLTFLTPNGNLQAHLDLLSEAMHVSQTKAEKRMARLTSFEWESQPLVAEVRHGSGLTTYSLSPHVVAYAHEPPEAHEELSRIGGFREAIIEHSRVTYATPRAEVERSINEMYGIVEPETEEDAAILDLRRRLENVGITSEQVRGLIAGYEIDRIERQLAWLPYRNAKNPAGFLIAAIEGDYEEPLSHRFEATVEATREGGSEEVPHG